MSDDFLIFYLNIKAVSFNLVLLSLSDIVLPLGNGVSAKLNIHVPYTVPLIQHDTIAA